MDEPQFWKIIGSSRKAFEDQFRQLAVVHKKLAKLSASEVRDFQCLLEEKLAAAFTWDLWGAAYLINGGCSDDGFDYFRAWLISRGQTVFEAAIRNPDSLAGLTDPERDDYEFEGLWGVAEDVYKELTGEDMPPVDKKWPTKPKGRSWDFDDDDKNSRKMPALAKIYVEE